jgi:Icc-related predicted phosphoesterase
LHPFFVEDAIKDVSNIDSKKLVFVTHYPPKGVLDRVWSNEHVGYEGYREFVDKVNPLAHIFGHIHEDNGYKKHDSTVFINCAATPSKRAYLLNLKTLEVEAVKL